MGILFATASGALVSVFTDDLAVIATAGSLMIVAAAFQLFDGLQGVSTCNHSAGPAIPTRRWSATSARNWCLGLPIGDSLCLSAGLGVFGLWLWALCSGSGRGRACPCSRPGRGRPWALGRGEYVLAGVAACAVPVIPLIHDLRSRKVSCPAPTS